MATILYENRDLAECRNEIIKCYIRDLIEEQNRVKEKAEITSYPNVFIILYYTKIILYSSIFWIILLVWMILLYFQLKL